MRDRFKELGIRQPFADDDTAWTDLADVALRAARETRANIRRGLREENTAGEDVDDTDLREARAALDMEMARDGTSA